MDDDINAYLGDIDVLLRLSTDDANVVNEYTLAVEHDDMATMRHILDTTIPNRLSGDGWSVSLASVHGIIDSIFDGTHIIPMDDDGIDDANAYADGLWLQCSRLSAVEGGRAEEIIEILTDIHAYDDLHTFRIAE